MLRGGEVHVDVGALDVAVASAQGARVKVLVLVQVQHRVRQAYV